jgi:hypothetical protein
LKEIDVFKHGHRNSNVMSTEKQSMEGSPYVRKSMNFIGQKKDLFSSHDGKSTNTSGLEMARKNYKAY